MTTDKSLFFLRFAIDFFGGVDELFALNLHYSGAVSLWGVPFFHAPVFKRDHGDCYHVGVV